jgi:uncharacterized membrane protein YfcA
MADLSLTQLTLVLLIFVWSGFVRTGLGFGGAMMALPLLLLVDNRPLVYLAIIENKWRRMKKSHRQWIGFI